MWWQHGEGRYHAIALHVADMHAMCAAATLAAGCSTQDSVVAHYTFFFSHYTIHGCWGVQRHHVRLHMSAAAAWNEMCLLTDAGTA
jgi:hypothetical protein